MVDQHPALLAYNEAFPGPMDMLAFECFGYYGYGNGRVLGAQVDEPIGAAGPRGSHAIVGGCADCARVADCWQACMEKAREVFPVLMEVFDGITADGITGPAHMKAWIERTEQETNVPGFVPPPPMILNVENMSHGSFHTAGMRYPGRGGLPE